MSKKDWNPELYLKFDKERIQPSIDLVSRIDFENPVNIVDIGCGPGNSTQILSRRWPKSKITGVDNSLAMIEKAKLEFPNQEWKLLDAGKDEILGKFDIVFSNATIQWIPNHFELLKKFKSILSDNGIIAIQLPLFFDMPLGQSIARISKEKRWSYLTDSVNDLFTIHNYSDYYNFLSELFSAVEIWVSDYIHILDSQYSILEMIRSTGSRPYIDRLERDVDKRDFEDKVLTDIKKYYPLQKDGKVLFPFKRLFFIAKK
jgi:trans-aconitate 2-methyltransferase